MKDLLYVFFVNMMHYQEWVMLVAIISSLKPELPQEYAYENFFSNTNYSERSVYDVKLRYLQRYWHFGIINITMIHSIDCEGCLENKQHFGSIVNIFV